MTFPLSQLLNKMVSGYLPAAAHYQELLPSHLDRNLLCR